MSFGNAKEGNLPAQWIGTETGKGKANWSIEKDVEAPGKPNVLKQSGVATYPVCIKDDTLLQDGYVEVRFKPISGKEDQAGGVIWRVKDNDNYYVCRANALEDNVVLYRTATLEKAGIGSASKRFRSYCGRSIPMRTCLP